jgi:hypothetical protein
MLQPIRLAATAALLMLPALAGAQSAPIKGDAILKHPLGVLASKSVDLVAAGQFDALMALRVKEDQADWKTASATDKKNWGARQKELAPTPAVFAELVRKAGELTVEGDSASLEATTSAGTLRQMFTREAGQWRIQVGPMFMSAADTAAASAPMTRVEGANLASHPASAVVLQYVDLLHAGKLDEAMARLGSTKAQAEWKALPASEKKESADFRMRTLPKRADVAKSLASGGVLLMQGDEATLNLITMTPATSSNSTGSSTTIGIPLILEQGQWKLAQ